MKKLLPLIILVVVFAALIIGYAMLSKNSADTAESTTTAQTTYITLKNTSAADVTAISYTIDGEKLSFILADGTWVNADYQKMPIDQTLLDEMASAVSSIGATRKIADDRTNSADYGLDKPSLTVEVKYSGGDTVTYIVGNKNAVSGGVYFAMSTDDAVYSVEPKFSDSFDYTIEDLIVLDKMSTIDKSEIKSVSVSTAAGTRLFDSESVADESGKSKTVWSITNEQGTKTELDSTVSDKLLSALVSLDLDKCADYDAATGELAAYGLDKPTVVTINYARIKSVSGAVTGTSQGSVSIDYSYKIDIGYDSEGKAYAKLQDSNMVFELDTKEISLLLKDSNS